MWQAQWDSWTFILFETKRIIALDVIERWFRFNLSIMAQVDYFDRDIRGLFLLIINSDIGG
jgi:hypothetical protein